MTSRSFLLVLVFAVACSSQKGNTSSGSNHAAETTDPGQDPSDSGAATDGNFDDASDAAAEDAAESDAAESDAAGSVCPETALGETAQDCPWAAVARDLAAAASSGGDLGAVLSAEAPEIVSEISSNSDESDLLDLWGVAINFNQLSGGQFSTDPVVNPAIVDELNTLMGVAPRVDRVTHAGVQHTYGYLFSVLQTPFGYKRARWVAPDVTAGFGLPDGTLGPTPPDGTLFGNATYLAGEIAFSGEPERATVLSETSNVSPAIVDIDPTTFQVTRLTEQAMLSDGRQIVLRTDFVPFPTIDLASAAASANTFWLIYSVNDSADGRSRLITAFPITTSSMQQYTSSKLLGAGKSITTQYNAWVDGLSGTTATGSRSLTALTIGN